jgi:CBS domain containing-hemolysin-like protein
MTDARSRDERAQQSGEAAAREPWYERRLHLFHLKSKDSIRDDIEDALAETGDDADVSPKERAMLKNVLELHRVRVDDVMIPRGEIVAVSLESTLGDLLQVFRSAGHSRIPVYRETIDDAKGMIHIRDFLALLAAQTESGDASLRGLDLSRRLDQVNIVRPVLFAPPSMPVIDLLVRMQATHTHMALVIDEYGGTDGLLSIEDLVERVVGDIEDEHDVDATLMVQQIDERTFIADARTRLEKVSEALKVDLVNHDTAEDIDTLGGLITTLAGRVPARGDFIAGPHGLAFEVLEGDLRRLKRVRVVLPDPDAEATPLADTMALAAQRPGAARATSESGRSAG